MSAGTPEWTQLRCGGGFVSTTFVFQTVQNQNAANSVYVAKSTADAAYLSSNAQTPKKYTFKSDWERMQYILGRTGSAPGCTGY
jgi:hypothetical protein